MGEKLKLDPKTLRFRHILQINPPGTQHRSAIPSPCLGGRVTGRGSEQDSAKQNLRQILFLLILLLFFVFIYFFCRILSLSKTRGGNKKSLPLFLSTAGLPRRGRTASSAALGSGDNEGTLRGAHHGRDAGGRGWARGQKQCTTDLFPRWVLSRPGSWLPAATLPVGCMSLLGPCLAYRATFVVVAARAGGAPRLTRDCISSFCGNTFAGLDRLRLPCRRRPGLPSRFAVLGTAACHSVALPWRGA